MHNLKYEALFAKWLNGPLSDDEQQEFERLCLEDPGFASQVETANQLNMTAEQFESVPVPHWQRENTFLVADKPKWWQWQGLPVASMAISAFALVLVITGFHVEVEGSKISMGFNSAPDEQAVAQLVDEKLHTYQQANQALFGKYVDAIVAQQKEASTQLTQYLLSSSRQERREDFSELVKFINEQRSDDQRFYARQINKMQQEIDVIATEYSQQDISRQMNIE
ncbi:hypothetical protein CA267_005135 [Alteromonas pelagimontana]|uniref:Uncharacterized protein n=1 Tax=Alteromonas pelagimontana TaxID=1858656 RepID=A0A6M4MAL0_9ALTE|nr:hypothetical protein [Alteromonas pelagimontana]QJR80202.1 hypothetical protein CA267_005135 [Alteromonas pelagimontana]